jgi:hypothetical protein
MCKSRHDFYNENNKRFIEEWRNDRATVLSRRGRTAQVFISSRTDNSHTAPFTASVCVCVCLYGKIHRSLGAREIGQKKICFAMRILKEAFCAALQLCHFRRRRCLLRELLFAGINSDNCNRLNSALCTLK